MSQAAADRNLLFGILALQMDFIGRDALIAAMHAWVLDKAKPLGQILLDQGALAGADHPLLEAMVQRHLEKHGGDVERSLAAAAAPDAVRAELRRITDDELHASLAQLPVTPSAGENLGSTTAPVAADGARFQILRPHARGGLGEVFVARDGELNREVALKEIQTRHADHPESRARFVREAEITGGLEHPGIVPVYGLGQYNDGRPFYAMRFIRGTSLKEAIDRFHAPQAQGLQPLGFDSLAFRQLLNRFIAVCNAIAYAHSRGVLHRDLKPANIMLGEFGETLVVDWGLAKAGVSVAGDEKGKSLERTTEPMLSPSDSDLTRTGQALGTPAYMSPEQAAGRLDQLGPASDVYSLGATLYCLLTGQAPFAKGDVGAVLNQVQRGDFLPPRRVNRQVPTALEAICLKAMALRPQDRYASAKALADDLEHWLADEAVTAHAEPWHARLGRWVRHHKGLVGSAAAVLVVGLTVAVASWLVKEASVQRTNEQELRGIAESAREEADKQRRLANRYLYFSRISLADRAWQEAHITRMEELLEQTQDQQSGGEDLRGFEWDYVLRRIRQASLLTIKGHSQYDSSVVFCPNGQCLASASSDGKAKFWDARTGQECLTLKGHTSPVLSVAFSPDGQRLASGSSDNTVKVWDARTGQERLTLKGHTSVVTSVAFSPDGERLASASYDQTVRVWDAWTGQRRFTIKGHAWYVTSVAFSPNGERLASASYDQTVRVWDARTGLGGLNLRGHTGGVYSVTFSPDGQHLASASDDKTVKVWDAHTGEVSLTLKGHTNTVKSVAFSPDGLRLASGSDDGTVKIWDALTGQEGLTLKGHTNWVDSVAFSPDGQRLASASGRMLMVWDATPLSEESSLQRQALSYLGVTDGPQGSNARPQRGLRRCAR